MEYAFKDAEDTADRLGDAIEDTADDADSAANGGFTVLKGAAAELVTDGFEKVVDILKDTVIEMGNVDSAINDFQNKTGATAEEMTQYGETIKDLYRGSIGESMDDISDSAATVKRSLGDISPETLEEEVLQNVAIIVSTPKFSVPLDRGLGLAQRFIDKPIQVAQSILISEVLDAVEEYEPRAEVTNVTFEAGETPGLLVPVLEVNIVDNEE